MRKIAVVLAVAGIALLTMWMWEVRQEEKQEAIEYSKMEEKLIPLNVQKRKLEQKLISIADQDTKSNQERATISLLFVEPKEEVYTETFPIMKECGYTGVLVLTKEYMPGQPGALSLKQFQKLLKEGWDYCVGWEAGADVTTWHGQMQSELQKKGLETGETVYFELRQYKKDLVSQMKELGYTIVIHHGEKNLDLYPAPSKSGLWYPGSCGMQTQGPKAKLRQVVSLKRNLIYTIGFTQKEEMYEQATFERMIKEFMKYENEKELSVMSVVESRDYHRSFAIKGKYKHQMTEEELEIQAEIDAIQMEIDALYEEYNK